ncbi:hypothetical protein [Streptomyces sp. TRM64462]|uniref:hypothetical protein n=1 Tax=Streptomyces sp. TRM64462 TaxID=2741726 RepID=UPI0020C78D76|nr:hypothetical protein [Streptomyces sp. TRM64462]
MAAGRVTAGRLTAGGRGAVAWAAALCVAAAVVAAGLPARPAWAAGEPAPYAFAEGIRPVKGAATTSDAPSLEAGAVYKDAVRQGGPLIYRVDLDAVSHAYVSVVAVPPGDAEVTDGDRLKVSLQDRDGSECSSTDTKFGYSTAFPRPLAAYVHRTLDPEGTRCQKAGPYYVVVEREGEKGSPPQPWDLEIRHVLEPGLKEAGPTAPPENWPSASPEALAGGPTERAGGTSFSDAPGLSEGEWTDRIEPGQSRFYRVPVDWGEQLFVSADLGSSTGDGYVGGALPVSLYNPALGLVDSLTSMSYNGRQKSASFDPLPPVAYENRFSSDPEIRQMRFAGWYYLRVTLNPEVGEKFGKKPHGLTLRIHVGGERKPAPPYAGPAGIFTVSEDDRQAAADGHSGPQAERSGTMRLVAAGGIGTGTVLLLGLGLWTVLARRRAASSAALPAGGAAGGAAGAAGGAVPGAGAAVPSDAATRGFGPPPAGGW